MKKNIFILLCLFPIFSWGQANKDTTLEGSFLQTVIVTGIADKNHLRQKRYDSQARTETLLEYIPGINLISRGNFAQEPVLHGMSDGQINVTINGMRIFGACTDRMDPATSYVEPNNLKSVEVLNGPAFGNGGATIGGSMNFVLRQARFDSNNHWGGSVGMGYETNAKLRQILGSLQYSGKRFSVLADGIFRKADDYLPGGSKAGNIAQYGQWTSANGFSVDEKGLMRFSQFQKWNAHLNAAYQLSVHQTLRADYIQDEGRNIGYPALTMDVAFANSKIASLSHEYSNLSKPLYFWETKLYFNHVNHAMDDTKRPAEQVSMHMDMPGHNNTYGAYSQLFWKASPHQLIKAKLETYTNRWHAEMTMYPNNGGRPMFMLTIPDAQRSVAGIDISDRIHTGRNWHITPGARLEYDRSSLYTDLGKRTMTSIYSGNPGRKDFLYNFYLQGQYQPSSNFILSGQIARAMRNATSKELYAFYLFDRVDNYDYLGNPALKKETSVNGELRAKFHSEKLEIESSGFGYFFQNYIAGFAQEDFSPMTMSASGVKRFDNISSANIIGASLVLRWQPIDFLSLTNSNTWQRGLDKNKNALPMMPPFHSINSIRYQKYSWNAFVESIVAVTQDHFSGFYGEKRTPGFGIVNAGLDKTFRENAQKFIVSITGNNLFNKYYYEHLDVIKLPRMGRNVILHLSYIF